MEHACQFSVLFHHLNPIYSTHDSAVKNQLAAALLLDTTPGGLEYGETGDIKCSMHLKSTSPYGA
jgi:hypothetical protein